MQIKVRVNETLKVLYSNQLSYEIIKYLYIEKQNYIIFLNYAKIMLILLEARVGLEPTTSSLKDWLANTAIILLYE